MTKLEFYKWRVRQYEAYGFNNLTKEDMVEYWAMLRIIRKLNKQ